MLALRKPGPTKGLLLADLPEPKVGPDEVLVEVAAAGICGSDLHIDAWDATYHFIGAALPVTLGHEFAGRVATAGAGVRSLRPGQMVVVMPSVTCGVCAYCAAGNRDGCVNRRGIGMTRDGAFARFVAVPERNCIAVPDSLDPAVAALAEPLTVCWQAVQRSGVQAGSRCLVLGPGTIGQGIALMARRAGAEVVVAGLGDASRLATVRALGFDRAYDLAAGRDVSALAATDFDAVIEATGASASVSFGLERLRPGGVFVATGIHAEPAAFDVTNLVRRQQDIRGSYRAPIAAWPEVVKALVDDADMFAPMITHRLPLAEGLEGFALCHRKEASKVALLP